MPAVFVTYVTYCIFVPYRTEFNRSLLDTLPILLSSAGRGHILLYNTFAIGHKKHPGYATYSIYVMYICNILNISYVEIIS
jgi:hypothetical protein